MHSVVLDTNIVISAAISPNGNLAKIVNMALDKTIQINLSTEILAEYEEVLSRTEFSFNPEKQGIFLSGLRGNGNMLEPTVSDMPMPDEDDRIFYDAAKAAGAILITGNTKHYPAESFILTPSDFIALLENN